MPFALNARTDAYLRAGDRDRGRAAGGRDRARPRVPRRRRDLRVRARTAGRAEIEALVEGIGMRKLSVMAGPGMPSGSELEAMGVARVLVRPVDAPPGDDGAG